MKIASIELYHVSVPLKETFWPTWIWGYPQTHNRLKVIHDKGLKAALEIKKRKESQAGWHLIRKIVNSLNC